MLFDQPTATAGATPNRSALIVGAVLTIIVGFGLGFVLSGTRSSGNRSTTAAGITTTTSSTTTTTGVVRTSTSASTTEAPTTTVAPTTTTAAPTTVAPTTAPITVAPTISTVPRTAPPTVAPPTTYAPPKVLVTYAADSQGRLVIPRSGSATITVTNQGGLASQWLVTGSGFTTGGGQSQGTLGPGQSQFISVFPPAGEIPRSEQHGIISVLGATNPSVPFVIPAAP
jgi:hypothetical protein